MIADIILRWNAHVLAAGRTDYSTADHDDGRPLPDGPNPAPQQPGPTATSRAFAMIHVGMHDAYVDAADQRWTGIAGPALSPAARQVAVSRAAADLVAALYTDQAGQAEQWHAAAIAAIAPTDDEREAGEQRGRGVAAAIVAARRTDGAADRVPFVPRPGPFEHTVVPSLDPHWGNVVPFCIQNVVAHLPGTPWSRAQYERDHEEVKQLGRAGAQLTAAQRGSGIFWAYDGARNIGVPPVLYNQVVGAIVKTLGNVSEATNARLFAVVNVALADAGIQCWAEKYRFRLWRPDVGVPAPAVAGVRVTPDPTWRPLGAPTSNQVGRPAETPAFPAYPSGHATFGAAALRAAEVVLGLPKSFQFAFTSDELDGTTQDTPVRPTQPLPRTFTVEEAIEDNLVSRVFLGVHWRMDGTEGRDNGLVVGERVATHFPRRVTLAPDGTPIG